MLEIIEDLAVVSYADHFNFLVQQEFYDLEAKECPLCLKFSVFFAVAECCDVLCWTCALKLRLLNNALTCPFCKAETYMLILYQKLIESGPQKRNLNGLFTKAVGSLKDKKHKLIYGSKRIKEISMMLTKFICWNPNCTKTLNETPYNKFKTIQNWASHLINKHNVVPCEVCVSYNSNFVYESVLYHPSQIKRHCKFGGIVNQIMINKHIWCPICSLYLFDVDEFKKHCQLHHVICEFCFATSCEKVVYKHLDDLARHYETVHYSCDKCTYIAFKTYEDLLIHLAKVHKIKKFSVQSMMNKDKNQLNLVDDDLINQLEYNTAYSEDSLKYILDHFDINDRKTFLLRNISLTSIISYVDLLFIIRSILWANYFKEIKYKPFDLIYKSFTTTAKDTKFLDFFSATYDEIIRHLWDFQKQELAHLSSEPVDFSNWRLNFPKTTPAADVFIRFLAHLNQYNKKIDLNELKCVLNRFFELSKPDNLRTSFIYSLHKCVMNYIEKRGEKFKLMNKFDLSGLTRTEIESFSGLSKVAAKVFKPRMIDRIYMLRTPYHLIYKSNCSLKMTEWELTCYKFFESLETDELLNFVELMKSYIENLSGSLHETQSENKDKKQQVGAMKFTKTQNTLSKGNLNETENFPSLEPNQDSIRQHKWSSKNQKNSLEKINYDDEFPAID